MVMFDCFIFSYFDLITNTNLKPKKIHVVEKPVADALGMNLDITKSTGTLVVDIKKV